jgi:predicted transposase YbfD/YdcC
LNEEVRLFLETEAKKKSSIVIEDNHEDFDKGHGRVETRKCFVSSQIDWLTQKEQWVGLKTIAMIEETQEVHGKASTEQRFFINSLPPTAERIASTVRSHWLIENGLHWILDVIFNEDQSRVRKDNAGENMALIRHITLNMLNNAKKQIKKGAIESVTY